MPLRFSPARGAGALALNSLVRGPTGSAATIAVGTTSTLAAGNSATVTNSGSTSAATFNFGVPRGADPGIKWLYATSTSMADPSSGNIRLNNATIGSVTAIAVSATGSGVDVSDYVATWDDSGSSVKGYLHIREEGTQEVAIFSVSSVTDNSTWLQLAVTYVSGSLTLSASDPLYLTHYRTGDVGTIGGTLGATANVIPKSSGVGGATLQASAWLIDSSNNLSPTSNDGGALGTTALKVSDAFFASGGVLNWNSGDVTVTHSAALLTFSSPITLGTSNAFTCGTIELGAASDTTLSRSSAGVLAVEGVTVSLNSTGATHTAGTIELGAATDTTLSRSSAGVLAVEGVTVSLNSTSSVHTASTIELGNASDTTLSRSAAGVLAVEGVVVSNNLIQNSQSTAYTTVLADAGKHILHPTADNNARTFTIDSNANVAYPLGTMITFVNQINTVTIAITSDTLTLAGAGTTGSRTLAASGIATAIKVGTTSWIISGTGLS